LLLEIRGDGVGPIFCQTGAMTYNDKNSAKAMMIWLEGACWVPIAWRRNDSTTTMRVNEVRTMRTAGPRERRVRRKAISTAEETSVAFTPWRSNGSKG
jgi:hypothetical protein